MSLSLLPIPQSELFPYLIVTFYRIISFVASQHWHQNKTNDMKHADKGWAEITACAGVTVTQLSMVGSGPPCSTVLQSGSDSEKSRSDGHC